MRGESKSFFVSELRKYSGMSSLSSVDPEFPPQKASIVFSLYFFFGVLGVEDDADEKGTPRGFPMNYDIR